jgi:hypothetical protein
VTGALTGYRALGSVMSVADTFWGVMWAVDASGNPTGDYEAGLYTYSAANTVTRTTVLRSSNANALVAFAAGTTKYVAIGALASRVLQLNNELAAVLPIVTSDPAAAATDTLKVYAKKKAGRIKLTHVGPAGWDGSYQMNLGRNFYALWKPPGNSTTVPAVLGLNALTAVGTATARNVATTNLVTRANRLGYVSAATAASLCGHYQTAAQFTLGVPGTPNIGGFELITRFAASDAATVAGPRQFVGMSSNVAAPTNVEPSTLTNCIGVGHGTADTNLKIYYGGSAAQTVIDLGANFPANTLSVDLYELTLFAPPNVNNVVYYRVERLNTGQFAEGTLTGVAGTALPLNTTLLAYRAWRCNNATALACGFDAASLSLEKDD